MVRWLQTSKKRVGGAVDADKDRQQRHQQQEYKDERQRIAHGQQHAH